MAPEVGLAVVSLLWRTDSDAMAAFAAPRVEDFSASLGLHSRSETVRGSAALVTGLVRSLHALTRILKE